MVWLFWFLVAIVLILLAALIGAAVYWIGLDTAIHTAERTRESMISALSRSEGPVATG